VEFQICLQRPPSLPGAAIVWPGGASGR
jgi:hypothetical protein